MSIFSSDGWLARNTLPTKKITIKQSPKASKKWDKRFKDFKDDIETNIYVAAENRKTKEQKEKELDRQYKGASWMDKVRK